MATSYRFDPDFRHQQKITRLGDFFYLATIWVLPVRSRDWTASQQSLTDDPTSDFRHQQKNHPRLSLVVFVYFCSAILFSIVTQEEVSNLVILPHKLRYSLKVCSSIHPVLKSNLSQLSVSAHSLRAILNFESISARLWGYCASLIFA